MANPASFRIALAVALSFPLMYTEAQVTAVGTHADQPAKRLVADYDSSSKFLAAPYTYTAAQIPYSKITHIIHSGVGFDADGNLQVPAQFIEPTLIPSAHAAPIRGSTTSWPTSSRSSSTRSASWRASIGMIFR